MLEMRRRLGSGQVLLTLLLVMGSSVCGFAENGRDFAGFYEVSDVVDNGDGTVSLTFAAEIINFSGGPCSYAEVLLGDRLESTDNTVVLEALNLSQQSIRVEGPVTVPSEQFLLWQQRHKPELFIHLFNGPTDLGTKRVELVERAEREGGLDE